MSGSSAYYVSQTGSDTSGDGSAAKPFASLQRAQAAMEGSSVKVTQIASGTYQLTSALSLTAADSGETFEAASGAKVDISGGQLVTGFTAGPNGTYTAPTTLPVGVDLFVNDVRQLAADTGYNSLEPATSGWNNVAAGEALSPKELQLTPAEMTSDLVVGATVELLDSYYYSSNIVKITAVDTTAHTVTFSNGFSGNLDGAGAAWRVLGQPADLTEAGSFAYDLGKSASDPTAQHLILKPSDPAALLADGAVLPTLNTLVSINGATDVTLSGLTFTDTVAATGGYAGQSGNAPGPATVMLNNASGATLIGDTFTRVGNGLLLTGTSNSTISGNTFSEVDGTAASIEALSNNDVFSNNTISDTGLTSVGASGLVLLDSGNDVVAHNRFLSTGGISAGGTSETSAFNGDTITGNFLQDTINAAIYFYAGSSSTYLDANLTISDNRIEGTDGLTRTAAGVYQASGDIADVYLDNEISGVTVTGNVVEGGNFGVFANAGANLTVDNNVFILRPYLDFTPTGGTIQINKGTATTSGTFDLLSLPGDIPTNDPVSVISVTASYSNASGLPASADPATFTVSVDGQTIGHATASTAVATYDFTAALTPSQTHTIEVAYDDIATAGAQTFSISSIAINGNYTNQVGFGSQAIGIEDVATKIANFSAEHNIIYGADSGHSSPALAYTSTPITFDYNDYWGATKPYLGQPSDVHSVIANPNFVDAAHGNYDIAANSPAYGIGFSTKSVPLDGSIACFANGTLIQTKDGYHPVEMLRPGDRVVTYGGRPGATRPIVWVGRRTIDCARHPRPETVRPIRVARHAFGPGLPARPLFLSPDHALLVDGVLIPLRHLVDGGRIRQVAIKRVTYHHIELDAHDVLLAEGLPAESYLDTGKRNDFEGGPVMSLHPEFASRVWEAEGCTPLVIAGPMLEAARNGLARSSRVRRWRVA